MTRRRAALALCAELADSVGKEVRAEIPGSATTLAVVALTDPGLLLLSPPGQAPTAYAPHSYWLL